MNPDGCSFIHKTGKRAGNFCVVGKVYQDGFCLAHWKREQKKLKTRERKQVVAAMEEQDNKQIEDSARYVPVPTQAAPVEVETETQPVSNYSSIMNKFFSESVGGQEQASRDAQALRDEREALIEKLNIVTRGNPGDIENMDIVELRAHLAKVTSEAINDNMREKTDLSRNNNAGKALFKVNVVATQALEALSITFADRNPNVPDLSGITHDVVSQKDEFEEVLQDIYLEYADDIGPLLGPFNRYMLMMGSKITTRAVINKKNTS